MRDPAFESVIQQGRVFATAKQVVMAQNPGLFGIHNTGIGMSSHGQLPCRNSKDFCGLLSNAPDSFGQAEDILMYQLQGLGQQGFQGRAPWCSRLKGSKLGFDFVRLVVGTDRRQRAFAYPNAQAFAISLRAIGGQVMAKSVKIPDILIGQVQVQNAGVRSDRKPVLPGSGDHVDCTQCRYAAEVCSHIQFLDQGKMKCQGSGLCRCRDAWKPQSQAGQGPHVRSQDWQDRDPVGR